MAAINIRQDTVKIWDIAAHAKNGRSSIDYLRETRLLNPKPQCPRCQSPMRDEQNRGKICEFSLRCTNRGCKKHLSLLKDSFYANPHLPLSNQIFLTLLVLRNSNFSGRAAFGYLPQIPYWLVQFLPWYLYLEITAVTNHFGGSQYSGPNRRVGNSECQIQYWPKPRKTSTVGFGYLRYHIQVRVPDLCTGSVRKYLNSPYSTTCAPCASTFHLFGPLWSL